jgi:ribosome biogenesis GTPase
LILKNYGWKSEHNQIKEILSKEGFELGRVILQHKRLYRVITEHGEVLASISGKFRFGAVYSFDYPCVGDWVALTLQKEESKAVIHRVIPRRTTFWRQAVGSTIEKQIVCANMDTVFLVQSLHEDLNMRRLERYLILAWESGAQPIIILSKADLCYDIDSKRRQVEQIAIGVPIHCISVYMNQGIDELTTYLQSGQTIGLLGSSGVGKSTLANQLVGQEVQKTQAIREKDGRGRHTTTYRELIPLPHGGCLIDTPGMREIQIGNIHTGMDETFTDIQILADSCHFRNCSHQSEPDCAILQALRDGTLKLERYISFLKLQKELDYHARKTDKKKELEEKKLWKQRSHEQRQHLKNKKRLK